MAAVKEEARSDTLSMADNNQQDGESIQNLLENELLQAAQVAALTSEEEMAEIRREILEGVALLQEEINKSCPICGKMYKHERFLTRHMETHCAPRPAQTPGKLHECEFCLQEIKGIEQFRRHQGREHGIKPFKCSECDFCSASKGDLTKHKTMHRPGKFNCSYCDQVFKLRTNLKKHEDRVHLNKKMKCDYCEKEFSTSTSLYGHIRATHTGERPYICPDCGMTFAWSNSLSTHKLIHTNTWPYSCDMCSAVFRSSGDMNKHKKRHFDKTAKCPLCPKMFSTNGDLNRHLKISHSPDLPFSCEICKKSFKRKEALAKHTKVVHLGEKKHKCHLCGKNCSAAGNLALHIKYHNNERNYKCERCSRTFIEQKDLEYHMQRHDFIDTGVKKFECDICGKKYATKKCILRHRTTHSREKSHACPQCPIRVKTKANLRKHMITHDSQSEKEFACLLCDAKFRTKANLQTHQVIHTGEKPHKCSFCSKGFSQMSGKVIHEARVHKKEKPYECELCPKRFVQKGLLRFHVAKMHSGVTYACSQCPARFRRQGFLKYHEMKHQGCHFNTKIWRPLGCDLCAKRCKTEWGLKLHKARVHLKTATQTDYPSNAQSYIMPDAELVIVPQIQSDIMIDNQTDIVPETQSDIIPDNQADIKLNTQSENVPETEIMLDIQSDIVPYIQSDLMLDTRSDIRDIQSDMPDTSANITSRTRSKRKRQKVNAKAENMTDDSMNNATSEDDDVNDPSYVVVERDVTDDEEEFDVMNRLTKTKSTSNGDKKKITAKKKRKTSNKNHSENKVDKPIESRRSSRNKRVKSVNEELKENCDNVSTDDKSFSGSVTSGSVTSGSVLDVKEEAIWDEEDSGEEEKVIKNDDSEMRWRNGYMTGERWKAIRPFVCHVCNRTFRGISNLSRHRNAMHGKRSADQASVTEDQTSMFDYQSIMSENQPVVVENQPETEVVIKPGSSESESFFQVKGDGENMDEPNDIQSEDQNENSRSARRQEENIPHPPVKVEPEN